MASKKPSSKPRKTVTKPAKPSLQDLLGQVLDARIAALMQLQEFTKSAVNYGATAGCNLDHNGGPLTNEAPMQDPASPRPTLRGDLGAAHDSAIFLHKTIDELENVLAVVLAPGAPEPGGACAPPEPPQVSDAAIGVRSINADITRAVYRLQSVIRRLEL